MKLTDLEPEFMKWNGVGKWKQVESVAEADGLWFLCPKCFTENDGRVGTHMVMCWSPTVPQTESPTPGRWNLVGTGLEDLSLVAGSSSIHLAGPGCGWHGFIKNGEATI